MIWSDEIEHVPALDASRTHIIPTYRFLSFVSTTKRSTFARRCLPTCIPEMLPSSLHELPPAFLADTVWAPEGHPVCQWAVQVVIARIKYTTLRRKCKKSENLCRHLGEGAALINTDSEPTIFWPTWKDRPHPLFELWDEGDPIPAAETPLAKLEVERRYVPC